MIRPVAVAALPASVVALALFLVFNLVSCSGGGDDPVTEQVAWLDAHLVPLAGCDPALDLQDLAPLAASIGSARIVGLGESTHGTREHFQLKHRLVRYLVEEHGFDIFAIEASTPEAHRLDAYVLGGEGDPRELIAGMYFWTWNTEEVLAMVEWMREYNARSEHEIHFTGFDMQTPDVAAAEVVAFLAEVDPARAAGVKARYDELVQRGTRSSFGSANFTYPVAPVRGKTVRFSAWIRTEEVERGYAGLWWRADGPAGAVLAFDNMAGRGLSGTTDWSHQVVELEIPIFAEHVAFGFLLTGTGRAWFDDASIALDGEVQPDGAYDLGFEGLYVAANHLSDDQSYRAGLDGEVVHGGHQSLCVECFDPPTNTSAVADAAAEAGVILAELEQRRDAWCRQRPAAEVDRALLYARIVHQGLQQRAAGEEGGTVRDAAMAANVAWLTEQHPDDRLVLWAHNYHVSRAHDAMGRHLADRFGADYLPVGFATAQGRYHAVSRPPARERVHELQTPPTDSFEARFARARAPVFGLDLRQAEPGSAKSGWLAEERPFRLIGAMAMDQQFQPTVLSERYDLVFFVAETDAARQLVGGPARP